MEISVREMREGTAFGLDRLRHLDRLRDAQMRRVLGSKQGVDDEHLDPSKVVDRRGR